MLRSIASSPLRSPLKIDRRVIQKRLGKLCDNGDPFTSLAQLAKRISCGTATIMTAIDESNELTDWRLHSNRKARAPRAIGLNKAILDKESQLRESDPANDLSREDVDMVMNDLMEQSTPKERAQLAPESPEQRKQLATIYANDPDASDRIWRKL